MAAIVAVAVVAGSFDVGALWIGVSVFAMWLLTFFVVRALSAPRPAPAAVPVDEPQHVRVIDPEPEVEPEPEPVAATDEAAAREWNIWDLDRVMREHAADNEELAYLLVYLREFANADGLLPLEFDPLVRESFGDHLTAGAL